MAKPPLQRDKNYPSSWKDIRSLGTECKLLAGTYSNKGITADFDENTYSIMLTDILPVRIAEGAKNIHLNIVTRKIDTHQDTFTTLQVTADGSQEDISEFKDCYCVKQALFYKAEEKSYAVPYFALWGSQKNVWLTQDTDGSLLAKIWNYSTGLIMIAPFYKQSSVWARFERIGSKNKGVRSSFLTVFELNQSYQIIRTTKHNKPNSADAKSRTAD